MSETAKYVRRTAADIQAMKTFYDGGRSFSEVGDEFGISPSRVEQLFRQHKVKTRRKTVSRKFLAAMQKRRIRLEREPLAELYLEEKLSIHRIAEKLGSTYHIVRSNLIAHRIRIRPLADHTTSRLTPDILRPLYIDRNLTAGQIAERLGYSVLTIRKKLFVFGIRKRVRRRSVESASASASTSSFSLRPSPISPSAISASGVTQKNAPVIDVAGADRQALTITEAAVRLNKSVSTVNNLIKSGGFPNSFLQVSGQRRRRMIPIADLDSLIVRTGSGGGKKGCLRGTEPNAAAIEGRGAYARAKMKRLHGYGKREISEMIALGKNGLTLEEIAVRFRLDKGIVADLLAQAAGRERLKRQKSALKPSHPEPHPKNRHSPKKLKKLPGKAILLELYGDARLPKKAILSKLKINDTTLYNALLRYGIPLRSVRSRQRSEEREQMLRQMFLTEKLPLQTIADRLGLSLNRVRRSLRFLRNDDGTPLR